MSSLDSVSVGSSGLYRLFTRGPDLVSLVDGRIRLEKRGGPGVEDVDVERMDDVRLGRFLFWARLTFHISDHTRHSIGGLDLQAAVRFHDAVRKTARRHADALGPRLEELGRHVDRVLAGGSYFKHSESKRFHEVLVSAGRQPGGLVRSCLRPRARTALDRLAPLESPERFEAERSKANRHFIEMSIPRVKAAARSVLSYPLTDEQAEAIATDEDVTLVLAGAGTGKTATIVSKVAHLVRNEGVQPAEILVLAYNRKAAKEIRERLPRDLSGSQIRTFHAFGRSVIAKSGRAPSVSKVAQDRSALIQGDREHSPRSFDRSRATVRCDRLPSLPPSALPFGLRFQDPPRIRRVGSQCRVADVERRVGQKLRGTRDRQLPGRAWHPVRVRT